MSPSKRVDLLDGWRTLAVLTMVVWHTLWDMSTMFGLLPARLMWQPVPQLVRHFIVFSFVLLSGIACRYSRSNKRRGLQTAVCALVISAVTAIAGDPVKFGILHLLACCMLLYAAFGKWFESLPELPAGAVCLALFGLLWLWLNDLWVGVDWFFPLGFRSEGFYSADYYPLFPWLFLFLLGSLMGRRIRESEGAWKRLALPRWLTWPGRHALAIYVVHQPVILGALTLLRGG